MDKEIEIEVDLSDYFHVLTMIWREDESLIINDDCLLMKGDLNEDLARIYWEKPMICKYYSNKNS